MSEDKRLATIRALVAANGDDALFRPSSIDRTIGCPGSVRLSARAPKEQRASSYAIEGSAAHTVAEEALHGIRQPDEWSDRLVKVNDMNGVFVDEEMVDSVGLYLDVVRSGEGSRVQKFVEHKLTLGMLDSDDPLLAENRGTADCALVDATNRSLTIVDLKYGRGVMVSGDSPQLKNYALMGMVNFLIEGAWKEVYTTVVQPRAAEPSQRVKRVEHDPNQLLTEFLGKLVGAMEASLEDEPPLKTGTWCRWCRAKTICPALREEALDLGAPVFDTRKTFRAGDALGALPQEVWIGTAEEPRPIIPVTGRVVLPAPTDLDPGEIATILERAPLFETWIEAIKHRAVSLLDTGTKIPGWMLTRRSGNRKWKDADTTPDQLRELGLQTSAFYTERKLRSPAQVEKLLPQGRRDVIESLVERPLGDVVLVRTTTAKQALPPAFGPIE